MHLAVLCFGELEFKEAVDFVSKYLFRWMLVAETFVPGATISAIRVQDRPVPLGPDLNTDFLRACWRPFGISRSLTVDEDCILGFLTV